MGGPGSGNWWNHPSRATCEGQKRVDLRYLRKRGWLYAGAVGSLSWSIGGESMGNIRYRVYEHGLELIYGWREGNSGDWTQVNELVRFAWTSQHLGGDRKWFRCPKCSRRCIVLYGGAYFRCRKCYRLGYQSQNEAPMWRSVTQAQKLRQRLGGSGSMDEPFPDKPKGMYWKTYDRICRRADFLEGRMYRYETAFVRRLAERYGVK